MKVSQQCNHKGRWQAGSSGHQGCSTRPTAWLLFSAYCPSRAPSPETPVAQGMCWGFSPDILVATRGGRKEAWATPVYFLSSSILCKSPFLSSILSICYPSKPSPGAPVCGSAWLLAHARPPAPAAHLPISRPPLCPGTVPRAGFRCTSRHSLLPLTSPYLFSTCVSYGGLQHVGVGQVLWLDSLRCERFRRGADAAL